ncbi:MAG: EAL domain-containing protein [Gammaproteobacteria bacterium]|nr:EAL domain-containing protein [Gammaproteobacteria bacterium]
MIVTDKDDNKHQTALIVDDDGTTRLFAHQFLQQAGFRVLEAADGLQALEVVQQQRPDIILLDVDMPKLDGFGTCTRVRAIPEYAMVPILMVTGLDDAQSIEKAYAAGATDFATKPINWTLLLHRLRYILRAASAVTELAVTKTSLINAQRIARMGSWEWHAERDNMVWSDELYRLLRLEPATSTPTLEVFLQRVHETDKDRVAAWIVEAKETGIDAGINHRIVLPDASERHVHQQVEAVLDSAGNTTALYATLQDVTERQHAEAKIRQLAYNDSLTSLPNREAFKERLHQALALARRYQRMSAVLFLDLDDFKRVNDTLGHTVGDLLLQAVAERLLVGVRDSDSVAYCETDDTQKTVARLGGDEFTILLSEIRGGEDAANVAQRILKALAEPFTLAGHEVFISPSIGITLFPQDGDDAEVLLKNADSAMYAAKRSGKNLYKFFDDSMNEATLKRLTMDSLLRKALERNELLLHYQPQMDLVDGYINGVEVLLRWHNPELGMVSPGEFIPMAEENGQIVPIGEWVLRTACAQAKRWIDEGHSLSRVAVNISVVQFVRPNFPDLIAHILQTSGLKPCALELEITESLLVKDVEGAIHTLQALKDIGVQLSIDDFGTGYSSLNQLKRFPIDRLKIDQSFVRDITSDPDDAAIALAVIGMAGTMNLNVVAEGVETEEQMRFLQTNRCNEMQGYHLSRPLPAEDMELLLREHQSERWCQSNESVWQRNLLLVDDDAATLTALTKILGNQQYRILTATSARESFDLLAKHEVGVVVADYQMPGMDGNQFLARVHSIYPRTTRIMLSGQSDMESLISAVNEGDIYRFLEKPVSAAVLRRTLQEAFFVHEQNHNREGFAEATADCEAQMRQSPVATG